MKGLLKRSFAVLLAVMIMLTQLPTVIAEENDITWFFDKLTCELVVEGTGEMPSYEPGARPWEDFVHDIRTVTIAGELTTVSGFAFMDFDALAVVNIEAPVEIIYNSAFENCYQLTDIFLPSSLRLIEDCAFAGCEKILNVFYFGSEDEWCGVENQSVSIDSASIIWDSQNLEVLISYETDYLVGDEFIAKVYVHTPDWQEYYINSYTVIGYDPYMCGEQEVIIRFGPYKELAYVCVNESIGPVEYTIVFENLKTVYNYSEQFYVEVYKCIGDEKIFIPLDECTVEGYDCCNPGMQTVTVSHGDFSETFEVVVNEKGAPEVSENPSGSCGENVYWEFVESENLLIVYGEGAMSESFYPPWKDYRDSIYTVEVGEGVTALSTYAFIHSPNLQTVILGEGVETIGVYAFDDCPSLTNVTLPSTVKSLGDFAFADCTSLSVITLPGNLKTIASYAFLRCASLSEIYFDGDIEAWASIDKQGLWDHEAGKDTANGTYKLYCNIDYPEDVCIGAKQEYSVGDGFHAEVYARAEDGSYYPVSGYTIEGFDSSSAGWQNVGVYYGDYSNYFEVYVAEKEIDYSDIIDVNFKYVQTEYQYGEDFHAEIYAHTADGISYFVEDYTVEGYDKYTPGSQRVRVSYAGYTKTFIVTVNEGAEIPYFISIENVKTEYEYGEDFYAEVYLDFEDGTREQIFDYEVEGFDSYTPGEQTVIIYCRDFTHECIVFVNEESVEESIQWQLKGMELIIDYYGDILNLDDVTPIFAEIADLTNVRYLTIKGKFYAIETQTFSQLASLYAASIEADVEAIHYGAFENCNSLRTVLLSRDIEYIDDGAFPRPLMNLLYQGSEEEYMSKEFYESFTNNTAASAKIYYNCAVVYMYVATDIKTNYEPGEEFSANYYSFSGPNIKENPSAPITVEGFDSTITGRQTVTLRYADRTTEIEVFVGEEGDPGHGVTIEFANVKTEYTCGEEFYVEVYEYSADGVVTQITDYEVEGFDPYTPGKQSVTISYGECQETFIVTVYGDEEPEEPEEPEYAFDWFLDYNELTITYYGEVLNYDRIAEVYEGIGSASNVRTLILKGDIGTIESATFNGLTSMSTVYIEANVKTIDSSVFYHCTGLKTIFISDSVEFIDPNAFTSYLTNFMYRGSEDEFNSRSDASGILNGAIAWGTMFYNSAYFGMYAVANVKTEYAQGEEFYAEAYRTEGGVLRPNSLYPIEITGFDSNTLGYQDVTLSYDGYSATFTVYVGEPTYKVSFDYVKTEYGVGEDFYIEIYINYSDGKSERVYDYVVEGFDNQTPGWHEVSVTYDNYTEYYDVYVTEKAVVEPTINIRIENIRTEYTYGEAFYVEVYEYTTDGVAIPITNYEVEGFDPYAPGKQTVTIRYGDYHETYIVTVYEAEEPDPEPEPSYEVRIMDVQTVYEYGEDFYAEVYLYYSDGNVEQVSNYTVEGFNPYAPGEQVVTVRYGDTWKQYVVIVEEEVIVAPTYEVTFENVKLDYEYGEDFYAEVYMRYSDGTAERIYNFEVEGYDAYAPGKQTVKVSCNNYYKNYIVTVNQKPIVKPEITPVITVSKEKCRTGNTVDVIVSISQNTGFANLGLEIEYDRALKLVAVNANKEVGATFTPAQTLSAYPYNLGFDSVSNNSFNGDLVTLTFEVPEGTVAGEYFVNVDFYKGRNGDYVDGISVNYDENDNPLFLEYVNGSVTTYDYISGDINNDGTVTNKDGTALLRYLAAWELEEINPDALDTDGDGAITNKDGTRLLRYLANWDVEIH